MIRTLWPALAALGAGLVWFATAAGSPIAIAIPVGVIGAIEIVWSFATLRAERLVMPRAVIGVAALCLMLAGFLLITGPLALVPFIALFVFHWSIAIAAVVDLRVSRAREGATAKTADPVLDGAGGRDGGVIAAAGPARPRKRRAGVFALALVAQAMLVAAIATPALAASEAGEFAVPHGTSHHGGH